MALIDLITRDVVKVPLESTSKEEVFHELVDLLLQAGKISDPDKIYDALISREQLFSTALEDGIAIPHAKTEYVDSLIMALGIAPQGIDADALDGKPSQLFFLILAPPSQSGQHIEALTEIARATKSSSFRRLLITSRTPDEVLELIVDS
jgi:nitrogen PTS system EIIA component